MNAAYFAYSKAHLLKKTLNQFIDPLIHGRHSMFQEKVMSHVDHIASYV